MNAERHQATAVVVDVVEALAQHGGWMSTTTLAEAIGVHRDTVRRVCAELAACGWIQRETVDEADRWTLGARLPQIGLRFQELLVRRAATLRAEFEQLTAPLAPIRQETP